MSAFSEAPGPMQIVLANDDHTFTLAEEALSKLLLRKDVANKKVVIVSVAGAFRKGKSFLLDFMLRYLAASERMDQEELKSGKWLGSDEERLEGFHWRGGSERDTTGILMWSQPFFRTLKNGEEVAVLVMDTQGAFDSQSTVKDCATIFALSTMISSVQIYNLSQNIQEDDLQHLQLFTEYGRLAMEKSESKPFQKLVFLVRDWSFPYEAEYGLAGGDKILSRRLEISDKQHPELQQLRRHIRSCFESISSFLMPHPGLKVATNPSFDGRLADIEAEFKNMLVQFMPIVLESDSLIPKEIDGEHVTGKDLLHYFKSYIKIYQGDILPEPKTMLEATAEANNLSAVNKAKELYTERMEAICGGDKPYLNSDALEHEHTVQLGAAVKCFKEIRKMGGEEFSESYLKRLEEDLQAAYESFSRHNESKNFFTSFRTPAVLFVVIVFFYVFSATLELIGLTRYSNFFAMIMGFVILSVMIWGASRLTGNFREIGETIDDGANVLWDKVLSPLTQQAGQKVAERYPQYTHLASVATSTLNRTLAAAPTHAKRE